MADPTSYFHGVAYNWPAIIAGVVASFVVQILLTMLGIGVGLLTLGAPAAGSEPLGVGWVAFLWWAVSGIVAAFVGGWIAGAASAAASGRANGLAAWALATVIVAATAALTAGTTSIAGNLAGPTAISTARLDALSREARAPATAARQQRPPTGQPQVDAARKAVAWGMLASFAALLIGAAAAFVAGGLAQQPRFAERPRQSPQR